MTQSPVWILRQNRPVQVISNERKTTIRRGLERSIPGIAGFAGRDNPEIALVVSSNMEEKEEVAAAPLAQTDF